MTFDSVDDNIFVGRKCVDYVGKVPNILANQTNRKDRGDRS